MNKVINYPALHELKHRLQTVASMHIVSLVLRCVVASIFLVAAVGKVFDYEGLVQGVLQLGWLPEQWNKSVAALLLVMEFVVGLLLLSERGVRWGAITGGGMATCFIAVTSTLVARGTSSGCPCLGIFLKLPPSVMLGVDILLLSACLVLFRIGTGTQPMKADSTITDGVRTDGALNMVHLSNLRRSVVPLLVTSYIVAIVIALQAGFARQERRAQIAQHRQIKLRYGDHAPRFALTTGSGISVSPQNLRGKWTLLCFVLPKCHACEAELRGIVKHQATWASKLNVVVVIVGKPLFTSPEEAARRYAQHNQLPTSVKVICDSERKVAERYCDLPLQAPSSVLLDRQGIVRFIQNAREEGNAALVNDIKAVLDGIPYGPESVALQSIIYGRPAPDGEILINGKWVKLSTIWSGKPLLLMFVLRGCEPCESHVARVERALGNNKAVSVVYVYPNKKEAEISAVNMPTRGVIAADASTKIHTAYQVWNAPATFLIDSKGKLLYASGERSNERELERLLQQGDSLAQSLSFRKG